MINVIVSSDPRYQINRGLVQTSVMTVLQQHGVAGNVEVEVNIVGDRKMHEINRQYRGIDQTTDVLSFPFEDPSTPTLQHIPRVGFVAAPDNVLRLGCILISYPQALEDAASDNKPVEDEISFLVEHGTTHLLGIHHD
ncbi:rRNA maturation RNase YbeY [Patescibacteria group bacterium]|nr:rRNA maturation RNase YbeY [Patescibacteria group bacterium]MCL5409491.1 rRNA maturation RNase YbeY [Patescibacteria group bacterium]